MSTTLGTTGTIGNDRERSNTKSGLALALVTVLVAVTFAAAALKFDAPKGWVSKTPTSATRVAEFVLAKAPADAEDATVTVYFFGGQGGSVQANLDRWIGQMAQPDGKPSKDVAKTSTMQTATGLKVSLVDVSGTYVAEVTPGSTERLNKPGFRQIAAVVETPDGPYFVKLTGPAGTVAKWKESLDAFLKSLRVE